MIAVPTGPVFDFHARLVPGPGATERLMSTMDAAGITRAAVTAGGVVDLDRLAVQLVSGGHVRTGADNEAVRDACAHHADRLVPFWFGNPYAGAAGYRRHAGDFRGLELSPAVHGVGYADPRVRELVRVAADAGHPVYTVSTGQPGARTEDLVELARAYPSVSFVLGHCGFTGVDTAAVARLATVPNTLVETSGCLSVVARTALDRLGPDRVLFGTEYPLQHPAVELTKYATLRLSTVEWRAIAWRNAHRMLSEEAS